jgi:signal transduction histidine kinase
LTALQARLENIADGIEPADPDIIRAMLAQTERLGRLVSQLLDLSRLESGVAPLHRERFPVEELLEQAADESRLHRPDVEVRVQVVPHALEVEGDIERLHQVVANLLENAARHSGPDTPIDVQGSTNGRFVVVEIADRGPGIPESDRARVFERFYRADPARATDGGGAGLGLSIARWIVDLHHGSIRAEARQPQGCRMVIELPGDEYTGEVAIVRV